MEKERKKAEKAKKFAEKQAKTAGNAATSTTSKTKEKKAKQDSNKEGSLADYVEETRSGDKKSGLQNTHRHNLRALTENG